MIDKSRMAHVQSAYSGRVLLFIGALSMGGAERQFIALAKGLKNRGVDVEVMLNYSGGHFLPELEKADIRYTVIHLGSAWTLPLYLLRAISAMRSIQPDVVYGFMGAGIKSTIFNFFLPSFKTIWGVRSSNIEEMQLGVSLKIAAWLDRVLSRYADAIIYNSHAGMTDRIALGWANLSTHVISNGIDYERFKPCALTKQETRERLGLRPEHIVFGMLARLDPMKDHSSLLSAFALLVNSDLRLVLTCEEHVPSTAFLRAKASELGITDKIVWAGNTVRSEHLLNALDVYVQSSAYGEGFPNAIGEAMAIGLPIVATDVGDCRRIVGDFGWVVSVKDSSALADAMYQALEALPLWDHHLPRCRIISQYSIERMVDSTLSVIIGLSDKPNT